MVLNVWRYVRKYGFYYLLIMPALIYLLAIVWYPLLYGVWLSFHEYLIKTPFPPEWVGLRNYIELFKWKQFYIVCYNTFVYSLSIFPQLGVGLAAALLLKKDIPLKNVWRAMVLIAYTMPDLVSGTIWKWALDPDWGVVNDHLLKLGLINEPINWLADPNVARWAVTLANAWHGFPFVFLILSAALEGIPEEFYEAAQLDGANLWERFRHITLPQIKSAFIMVATIRMCWNVVKWVEAYQITQGGPGFNSTLLGSLVYHQAFIVGDMGMGFAVGVFLFVVSLIFTIWYVRAQIKMGR